MAKPDVPCPICGRDKWQNAAGFGTYDSEWICGHCAGPAPEEDE